MKKLVFLLFAGIVSFSGCSDVVTESVTFLINEPVFMTTEDFRKSIVVSSEPQPISDYGKMCFYQGYIYISAPEKGIHIINNSDPSNPVNVGFVELLGNADLAIRNGKLYADALIDLVWFDISNPEAPEFEGRLENVFSKYMPLPQVDNEYGIDYAMCYDGFGSRGVVVGWEVKRRTETYSYEHNRWRWGSDVMFTDRMLNSSGGSGISGGSGGSGSTSGVNGSMSRFALYQNYLYTVINNNMSVIDLSGAEPVKAAENIYIGWNVETIFSYKNNMFMGTPSGMVIYSVENPLKPEFMSWTTHVMGCDPVVVENDIAYVTIHSGNFCGQNFNQLEI